MGHAAHDWRLNASGAQRIVIFPQPGFSGGGLHAHDSAGYSLFSDLSEVLVELITVFSRQAVADIHPDQLVLIITEHARCPWID